MTVHVDPSAEVSEAAEIGTGTYIWHHAQVREGAKIGRHCILGKDVYVDKNVVIGDDCKLQNGATLYDGLVVGNAVFVGPHVVFTNDLYPRAQPNDWEIVPTVVKDGASIGANATVLCGITIGAHAMVAAGSVVTHDVPDHGLVQGVPAQLRGYVCHCGRPLDEKNYCARDKKVVDVGGG